MTTILNHSPRSNLSSSSISSPPLSPRQIDFGPDTLHLAPPRNPGPHPVQAAAPAVAKTAVASTTTAIPISQTLPVDKPKRPRKRKEVGLDGKPVDDGKPKEKKPRKPREPKPANGIATATTAVKKQPETDSKQPSQVPTPSRQATLAELINQNGPSVSPAAALQMSQTKTISASDSNFATISTTTTTITDTNTTRPATSGQRYDPVRGIAVESYARPSQPTTPSVPAAALTAQTINRASASPSIASLIDNPMALPNSNPPLRSPQQTIATQSIPVTSHGPSGMPSVSARLSPSPSASKVIANSDAENAMEIDFKPADIKNGITDKSSDVKAPSKASSAAPTPKPTTAPKGTGSGLLSSSDLFGGPSTSDGGLAKGVNIDIDIPLNSAGGNHVNMAQEIIKKYGRDAINPRAAAHRERLMQVMAAANKLDGGSADDMSIDLMSEGEGDSNVEMGGMEDDRSGAADGDRPRKRRKKVEEYDLDDEFIDDTELAWQQQAAVAKDGFFVYSGPLITDAEAAKAEAAAANAKGGKRAGRARSKAASSTTHASFAEKKETAPASASTASATGAATSTANKSRSARPRGTGAPRKPRATKADKEKLEGDKTNRDHSLASVAAPVTDTTVPASSPAAPAATIPATAPSSHMLQLGQNQATSLSTAT